MRLLLHRIAVLLCLASGLALTVVPARAAEVEQSDKSLAEHSSEIFFGTIDIVTAVFAVQSGIGPAMNTEYTVLVSDVIKGNLRPQMMVVVRQDGGGADFADGDGPLVPGSEYLFFARYDPTILRYVITEPATGNVPVTSPEQLAELTAHWSDVVQQTACLYSDVLTLDGVVYARRDWNADKRYLDREQVGPTIATVAIQDTSATGCRADLADRTASRIPAGTKIQSVDGYASTFRVAVRLPDRHRYLYEAIWSANAKTGADLLDIKDRAKSIEAERSFECDDTAQCDADIVTTTKKGTTAQVVDSLLQSPANPELRQLRALPPQWLRLTLTLDDGSTVDLWIDRDTGCSQSGIELPVDDLISLLWTR